MREAEGIQGHGKRFMPTDRFTKKSIGVGAPGGDLPNIFKSRRCRFSLQPWRSIPLQVYDFKQVLKSARRVFGGGAQKQNCSIWFTLR